MSHLLEFQTAIAAREAEFVSMLETVVKMESPSGDVLALNSVANQLADYWKLLPDISVEIINAPEAGSHLLMQWSAPGDNSQLEPWLVVGHFDTVWPVGTLAVMPFQRDGQKLFGPGTYDMKADLVLAWLTVSQMQRLQLSPSRPVRFLFTCDEEVGSRASRELIESQAKSAFAALVLEPPLAHGALKTARKGVGSYRVEVTGRSAHAGVEPEKGRNAIVELAHQILKIHSLARPELGTTLNVGQTGGGTANNVVPEKAWAEVDARVSIMSEAARLDAEIQSELKPVTADTTVTISGGLNRPPMVRTEATAHLFEIARGIAAALGVRLEEGSTGGGSDGNFTSAVGCPTLDGLGLEGAGAHAPHEHIDLTSLPFRAALLAGLLSAREEIC